MIFNIRGKEITRLQDTIKKLEEHSALQKRKIELLEEPRKEIFALFNEAIPKEQNGRKKYMGDVALFYSTIFKDKLRSFIGDQLNELGKIGRSERGEDLLRSNVSCFRLIDEWMEKCTSEYMGDLEDLRNRSSDNKEFSNNLKKTYEI